MRLVLVPLAIMSTGATAMAAITTNANNTTTTSGALVDCSSFIDSCWNKPLNECSLTECVLAGSALVLDNHRLYGTIPASLSNLAQLKTLKLQDNQLSGTVPASFGNMTKLVAVDVSNNGLTGTLPATVSSLSSLETFRAQNNHLSGAISSPICRIMANLETCELSGSHFSNNFDCFSPCGDLVRQHCTFLCQPRMTFSVAAAVLTVTIGCLIALCVCCARRSTSTAPQTSKCTKVIVHRPQHKRSPFPRIDPETEATSMRNLAEKVVQVSSTLGADAEHLVLPPSCMDVLSNSELFAAGGAGRVYRCPLLKSVTTHRGIVIPAGTIVALKEMFTTVMGQGMEEFCKELHFLSGMFCLHCIAVVIRPFINGTIFVQLFVIAILSPFTVSSAMNKEVLPPTAGTYS